MSLEQVKKTTDNEDFEDNSTEAEKRRYIPVPVPDEGIYYGTLGHWSKTVTKNTEAHPAATMRGMMTFVGNAIDRDAVFLLGDSPQFLNTLNLHVGRSNEGRKGTATAPVKRVYKLLKDEDSEKGTDYCPNIHTGGLSTREGLAYRIRDPKIKGDDVIDDGVSDKRLFVIESEFENVLQQGSREGNTLSSALRDAWDGETLAPLTKTNQTTATDPHVSMIAHITPSELLAMLHDRHVTNGFLNRFTIYFAERPKLVPIPIRTDDDIIEKMANTIKGVVDWVRKEKRIITLSNEAEKEYSKLYREAWAKPSTNMIVSSLMQRCATIALRDAALFAVMEESTTITPTHLTAAAYWTDYWKDSVEFIWRDKANLRIDSEGNVRLEKQRIKLCKWLKSQPGQKALRTDVIRKCFNGHISATELDVLLECLELQTPQVVRVEELEKDDKSGTKHEISLVEGES